MQGLRTAGLLHRGFAYLCLLNSLPILVVIYGTIRALGQSPIFSQERVGYRERIFVIYKFRTIPRNGWDSLEAESGRTRAKIYRRFVAFLRKTGLDELPQLINIARGEMRFIGPRPLTADDYFSLPEIRRLRSMCHPGVTGLAQVNGGQALDPVSKLVLDVYQQSRLNLRLVILIVLRSAARIFGFTSAISHPCPILLERAKTTVADQLRAIGQGDDAALIDAVLGCSGNLSGSAT